MSIFLGRVEDGKLKLHRRDAFQQMVRLLEGKDIELELRKRRKKRTLPQNSYFHGVVLPAFLAGLAEHGWGQTDEDLKQLKDGLKWKFLKVRKGDVETVRSTASLNTEEMARFTEQIQQMAAEYGIWIPDPGEEESSWQHVA